jgi:quinol monooxygenase YgiN
MSRNTQEIHLIASMIAVPGKESELREVLRGLIGPTRKEPGCRRYEMYESERKGRYFADEIWQNREALDTHMQSAHFKIAAATQVAKLDSVSDRLPPYPYWHQSGFAERNPSPGAPTLLIDEVNKSEEVLDAQAFRSGRTSDFTGCRRDANGSRWSS